MLALVIGKQQTCGMAAACLALVIFPALRVMVPTSSNLTLCALELPTGERKVKKNKKKHFSLALHSNAFNLVDVVPQLRQCNRQT